ncbi:ABC transporter ATP-binding protein [Desulfovibrio sp. 86]|uniref:Outer membrane-specific lipoprotein transporter subunit ATP-binding component of ABC superfamily n=1 Tax=uncultured Desulfovibrio sp. TaxID=167968 RepID=A0A212L1Z4_9BACT|nr:ABC transporter ATP-binding protein [Desulfovibrio sp. 86]SCM71581.1 outer membrane-specific lipoprotein transporter subunit; ATP-binding component of ABC superfamily [uncultured Desulfovibrio sp.]VZH32963.1 Lipoprotein-releasing system ATP-binding protein LolD [Desulfovibrio sp. 86]
MSALYKFSNVSKNFSAPGEDLEILKNINLVVEEGEALAIVGTSGSGKSTLLHLMGALDTPSTGAVFFDGQDMARMTPDQKAAFRNRTLGFVFQFHHLLPEFSAVENVAMPAIIGGERQAVIMSKAREMLERVGLSARMESKISTLSGGERQRVAIARAVLMRPRVLLADEPTGNLDEGTGAQVGTLMNELNRELGMTLVVVTHNRELAAGMGRTLELKAGTLYEKNVA